MNKVVYWLLWGISLIGINYYAIGWAMWSTFAAPEEYAVLAILIAIGIYILLNAGVIQLFIAAKQQRTLFFGIGLIAVIIQFICMIILGGEFAADILLLIGSIILSIVLIIVQAYIKRKKV